MCPGRTFIGNRCRQIANPVWLLLIEDESRLARSLQSGLEEENFIVDVAGDGEDGESMAHAADYDLLIVDWRLPYRDGKTVIENLRSSGVDVPILMLTALGDVDHRVEGLQAGADDYLSKPFNFEELLARIRALLRRPPMSTGSNLLIYGELEINSKRREVRLGGERLDLRPKEFALLEDFMRHPDDVISRTIIAERVWGDAFHVTDNVIDVTVSGLRQKLSDAQLGSSGHCTVHIETIRSIGYRLMSQEM